MIEIVYRDESLLVCLKPPGVRSTDESGGLPGLLRSQLGAEDVRTVHRLDQVVGGLMVLALNAETASALSAQIMEQRFHKAYLALVHGCPEEPQGSFTDLLGRDKRRCMTYVADAPGKDVRQAILDYEVLESKEAVSLLRITLRTGRTHQIRVQCASRGLPLLGDRKYGLAGDDCPIALLSSELGFTHPVSGERLSFRTAPPDAAPWNCFIKK